ncbi:hypothetical protein Pcinc_019457 [Petrolisthes cinctipes]|uniref:Uncharacterized protein n=1 Tax=Petrolisthes cinctipes TaxID=88211 RepID=A0AAE1FLI7_PETCI|nr:hypothetical protein Pcinc_019457 [Petrolisthes cinctipes]
MVLDGGGQTGRQGGKEAKVITPHPPSTPSSQLPPPSTPSSVTTSLLPALPSHSYHLSQHSLLSVTTSQHSLLSVTTSQHSLLTVSPSPSTPYSQLPPPSTPSSLIQSPLRSPSIPPHSSPNTTPSIPPSTSSMGTANIPHLRYPPPYQHNNPPSPANQPTLYGG